MVPNIRIIFNFGVKDAIALSNATIAVAALMRYLVNFRKNHPLKFDTLGKPAGLIVDYNITLIMMPMLMPLTPIILPVMHDNKHSSSISSSSTSDICLHKN